MLIRNYFLRVATQFPHSAKGPVYCDHVLNCYLLYFSRYKFNSSLNFCTDRLTDRQTQSHDLDLCDISPRPMGLFTIKNQFSTVTMENPSNFIILNPPTFLGKLVAKF